MVCIGLLQETTTSGLRGVTVSSTILVAVLIVVAALLRSVLLSVVAHRHKSWPSTVGFCVLVIGALASAFWVAVFGAGLVVAGEVYYQRAG